MLIKPRFVRYPNPHLIGFLRDAISVLEQRPQDSLANLVDLLRQDVKALDASYKLELSNALTKKLYTKDEERDRAVQGIKSVIEGYTLHHDEALSSAADGLLRSMNRYSTRIHRLPLQQQTTDLNSLLQEWAEEPAQQEALNALGLSAWVAFLKQSNADFEAMYVARVLDEADKTLPSVSKLRPSAQANYLALHQVLTAHATLQPDAYADLLRAMNELTEKYNSSL